MNKKVPVAEPVHLVEDEDTGHRFLIYNTDRGVKVELRFEGERFWATQAQMADLFGRDQSTIARHVRNVLEDGELDESTNMQKVHIAGSSKPVTLHSLDMIISVGYRVNSTQGTLFRIWATDKLVQFATKGFVVDKERLKDPGNYDRVRELKETIREIRASEANLYAELKHICALCQDYDGSSKAAVEFYKNMQAKLFYAVTSMTPSEVLKERINANVEDMGMQTVPKGRVVLADAKVAKNALTETELKEMNRLTGILLDIFEDQLDVGRLTTMEQASKLLDEQLKALGRMVLRNGGSVRGSDAEAHVKRQYKIFDERRKLAQKADADAQLAELKKLDAELPKKTRSRKKA